MSQIGGIGPSLVRMLGATAPDLLSELLVPGKVLDAEVVSVFQDRAVLSFGRGARLEVALQTPLQEGQKVKVQVQVQQPGQPTAPQGSEKQPAGAQNSPAQQRAELPVAEALPQRMPIAQPNSPGPTIILKMVGREPQPANGQTTQMTATASKAAVADLQGARLSLPAEQPAQPGQPAPTQPQHPQVMWLPVPLPDGTKGWVQLQVEEEPPHKRRKADGNPAHQVRLWWQTPSLGAVQVTLDNSHGLSALFTAEQAASRLTLDAGLPALREALVAAGFPDVRMGVRQAAPGESVEPAKAEGRSLLDRRM